MKHALIAEHYVCLDELRSPANILDLGCRGFQFTEYFDKRGDFVIPIDMDAFPTKRPYLRFAVTDYTGICGIHRNSDPNATRISRVITDNNTAVNAITLQDLCAKCEIPYWDLIKIDIEGAEYEVVMSLTKAPAKQLSVEFHLHTGAYSQPEVAIMVAKLKTLGYKTVTHELTNQHGAGFNYWSSLFIR